MMIVNISYPKLRGAVAVVLAVAIGVSLTSIIVLKWSQITDAYTIWVYYRILTLSGIGLMVFYILILPFILHYFPHRRPENGDEQSSTTTSSSTPPSNQTEVKP